MSDEQSVPMTPLEPATPSGDSFPSIPLQPATPSGDNFPMVPLQPATPSVDVPPYIQEPPRRVTSFREVFDFFLGGITDEMFLEMTLEDTEEVLQEILMAALPHFEFPKQDIYAVDLINQCFTVQLTGEEMMIIRQYMISEWLGMQLATIDLVKQKYSGSDFKFTSQASHIKQLVALKKEYETKGFHLQRLYSRRRKGKNGIFESTFDMLATPQTTWSERMARYDN